MHENEFERELNGRIGRMRTNVGGDIRVSALGFGCGSVLGRVGRKASLRAMSAAWDAGITLFDTARSYGFGDAEAVLGEFLKGKHDKVVIATKYGIPPQKPSSMKRALIPIARVALPAVRALKRGGPARTIVHGEFSVAGLRTSLETSLRELGRDYIDILYLHEATTTAIHDQELMSELDQLAREGKLRRAGLYAEREVIAEGMRSGSATLSSMQFGADFFDPTVLEFGRNNPRGVLLVGNHPFGGAQRVQRARTVLAAMAEDPAIPPELREKLKANDWQMLLEAILGLVLDGTGIHTLVFSMMREDHLHANVRAIENSRFTSAEVAEIRARMIASNHVPQVA